MKIISLLATTALLGACASTASISVGTAARNTTTNDYSVTQDGTTYTLSASAPRVVEVQGSMHFYNWSPSGTITSGFAFSSTPPTNYAVAAGLNNGTYFAGVSGTLSGVVPAAGTANLTGGYAFVVNGTDHTGLLAITADFGAGTIVDTSAGIDVNGTISSGNISGSVVVGGESGNLSGGLYDSGLGGYLLVGAAVGTNMAGILSVR
jgi:hypothetical protein